MVVHTSVVNPYERLMKAAAATATGTPSSAAMTRIRTYSRGDGPAGVGPPGAGDGVDPVFGACRLIAALHLIVEVHPWNHRPRVAP